MVVVVKLELVLELGKNELKERFAEGVGVWVLFIAACRFSDASCSSAMAARARSPSWEGEVPLGGMGEEDALDGLFNEAKSGKGAGELCKKGDGLVVEVVG